LFSEFEKKLFKIINNRLLVSVERPNNEPTRSWSNAEGFGGVCASERSGAADTLTKDSVSVHSIDIF